MQSFKNARCLKCKLSNEFARLKFEKFSRKLVSFELKTPKEEGAIRIFVSSPERRYSHRNMRVFK